MKNPKKHGDRLHGDDDWLSEVEIESEDSGYVWRSQIRMPWRKRWLDDQVSGRRSRDNEGWDDDRIREMRRARKPYERTRRDRKRFRDDDDE